MKMCKHHKNIEFHETGLHVLESHPYIGASPDMLVECECHGPGIVEIKCPYSICEQTPNPDNYKHVDGDGKLKPTSPYYYQIQGQMGVLYGFLMD